MSEDNPYQSSEAPLAAPDRAHFKARYLPIVIALAVAFLTGAAGWLPHARQIEKLSTLVFGGCGLAWVMLDASRRGVRVGNWTGLLVLLVSPIGFLVWFIRHWRWRWWQPGLIYLGCLVATVVLSYLGYVLVGFWYGYPFSELMDPHG